MSDLKAIKGALKNPPTKADLKAPLATTGSAVLVAYRLLHDANGWHLPTSALEIVVLFAVILTALGAVAEYVGARKPPPLTVIALEHVEDMMDQVRTKRLASGTMAATESLAEQRASGDALAIRTKGAL